MLIVIDKAIEVGVVRFMDGTVPSRCYSRPLLQEVLHSILARPGELLHQLLCTAQLTILDHDYFNFCVRWDFH